MRKLLIMLTPLMVWMSGVKANPYGTNTASIPLFNLEYKGISIPISLEYSSMGIKVDEVADWVGHSWYLNTGYIDQIDMPDLDINGSSDEYRLHPLHDSLSEYPSGSIFAGSYSIFGASTGSISENGNVFTDKNGINYFFGEGNGYDYINFTRPRYIKSKISRKYLTRIINPKQGNAQIIYNFSKDNRVSYTQDFNIRANFDLLTSEHAEHPDKREISVSYYPAKLNSIECDEWRLEFELENTVYSVQGFRLVGLALYDKNNHLIKRYELNYTIYNANTELKNYVDFAMNPWAHILEESDVNSKRMFLTEIQEYNSANKATVSWNFEYHSPEVLPQRITYKQNAWGYFTDYTFLGSKFYDLIDMSTMPEITYYGNLSKLDIDKDYYETEYLSHLPSYFFTDAPSGLTWQQIVNQFDRGKVCSEIIAGMLKRIVYPLGNTQEFYYDTRPYGNLLTGIRNLDENRNEITATYYTYEEGAIPLGGWNYLFEREAPTLPDLGDICETENITISYFDYINNGWVTVTKPCNPIFYVCEFKDPDCEEEVYDVLVRNIIESMQPNPTRFCCFSDGSWFSMIQPSFKKVTSVTTNKGRIENIYTSAADPGLDNQPAELYESRPGGNGNPTSLAFLRGMLTKSTSYNPKGDILSKTTWKYQHQSVDNLPFYRYKQLRLDDIISIDDSLSNASYFKIYRAFNPVKEITNTTYEQNSETGIYQPAVVHTTESSFFYEENSVKPPLLIARRNLTYTPGNKNNPDLEETINYFYPSTYHNYKLNYNMYDGYTDGTRDLDELLFTSDECNTFTDLSPFMIFYFVNGEFTGGIKNEYSYKSDPPEYNLKRVYKIKPQDLTDIPPCWDINCNGESEYYLPKLTGLTPLLTYNLYDAVNTDYPVQLTDKAGNVTSYIYYKDSQRVKYKAVNATYAQIEPWDPNVHDSPSSSDIRSALPNAFITEYVYDSFNRLIKTIDPNGDARSVTFNSDGKVRNILDNDNKIIKQYDYVY